MILTKEQQLKDNLIEIVEHKIFEESKQNGKAWYKIVLTKKQMEQLLDILMQDESLNT